MYIVFGIGKKKYTFSKNNMVYVAKIGVRREEV